MQGSTLDSRDIAEYRADQVFCFHTAESLMRKVLDNKHINIRQFQTEVTARKEI